MIRCFIISMGVHFGLISSLVIMASVLMPAIGKPIEDLPENNIHGKIIYGSALDPADSGSGRIIERPPQSDLFEAKPTPVMTPIVNNNRVAPTLTPRILKAPNDEQRKTIHRNRNNKLLETEPTPTPKPTPASPEGQLVNTQEVNIMEHPTHNPILIGSTSKTPATSSMDASALSAPAVNPSALGQAAGVSSDKGLTTSKSGAIQIKGNDGIRVRSDGVGGMGDINQIYFVIALSKIEPFFKPPISRAGMECRVRFYIQRDGTISNIQIDKSTGISTYDQSAVQALEQAKLPPLYDGIKESYLDVVVTFNYERKQ